MGSTPATAHEERNSNVVRWLRRVYGDNAAEGRLTAAGRGPDHGIVWGRLRKRPIEIGQEDHRLRADSMLIEPVEAGTEIGATSAYWFEMEHLTGHVGIDLVNLGVEVEDVYSLWSLAFEDRTDLSLEKLQLPGIDRTRAIDGNRDFVRAFAHNAGQIET